MERLTLTQQLAEALASARAEFESAGIAFSPTPSPDAVIRSLGVDADSERALAQVVLYDSGELDLVVGDASTGAVLLDEHREITPRVRITELISTLVECPCGVRRRELPARRCGRSPGDLARHTQPDSASGSVVVYHYDGRHQTAPMALNADDSLKRPRFDAASL